MNCKKWSLLFIFFLLFFGEHALHVRNDAKSPANALIEGKCGCSFIPRTKGNPFYLVPPQPQLGLSLSPSKFVRNNNNTALTSAPVLTKNKKLKKKSKPGSGRMTQCYGSEILLQWSTPHLFQTFPIFMAGIWKLTLRDANLEDDNVRVDSSGGGLCGKSLQDGTACSQLLFVFSVSNGISEANSPKCTKNLGWKPYKLRFPASGLRGNVLFTLGRVGLRVSLSAAITPLLPSF